MPRKIKKVKKLKEFVEPLGPEEQQLLDNRIFRFKEILGSDYDKKTLNHLVASDVDYHDLENLISKGCSLTTAIEILV